MAAYGATAVVCVVIAGCGSPPAAGDDTNSGTAGSSPGGQPAADAPGAAPDCQAQLAAAVARAGATKEKQVFSCGTRLAPDDPVAVAARQQPVDAGSDGGEGATVYASGIDPSGGSLPSPCNGVSSRTTFCSSYYSLMQVWEYSSDEPPVMIGQWSGPVYFFYTLNVLRQTWTVTTKMYFDHGWEKQSPPNTVGMFVDCNADCVATRTSSSNAARIIAGQWYTDTFQITATAPAGGKSYPAIQVDDRVYNPVNGGETRVYGPLVSQRCDNMSYIYPSNTVGGCVFDSFTPTFEESLSSTWSEAVQVDYDAQVMGAPGAPGGLPLHRSRASQTANRNVSCPKNLPRPPADSGGSYSCDEYPYASTREGAASGNVYVFRMIHASQNSRQGTLLNSLLYNPSRVIDDDAFYVSIVP